MKIHVLTDDEGIAFAIEAHILGLGYECKTFTRTDDFQKSRQAGEPYYLIVDYLLAEGDSRELLRTLLESNKCPAGLLVMSGLPGFEDFLDELAELYAEAGTSFLFMEKPFQQVELGELLFRLGKGLEGRIFGCLRLPKYNFIHLRKFGSILRAARENLGLQVAQVVSSARKKGLWINNEEYEAIEADDAGKTIGCEDWFFLTKLLFESADCTSVGFEPWMHLRRVRRALMDHSYHFPKNFVLRRKLVELAKREQIEEKFHNLSFYGRMAPPRIVN